MAAREWLNGQMYPLMSLQIVIAIEALRTLVASERSIVLRACLLWMTIHVLPIRRSVSTIETRHDTVRQPTDHLKLPVRIAHI